MDQALLVCGFECRAHRVTNAEDTIDTESFFAIKSFTQGFTVNKFHDDGLTPVVFNGVIHGDDVVVIEICCSDCFTSETFSQR